MTVDGLNLRVGKLTNAKVAFLLVFVQFLFFASANTVSNNYFQKTWLGNLTWALSSASLVSLKRKGLTSGPRLEIVDGPNLVLNNKAVEVNVTWKGVQYSTPDDIVGVFSCHDEDCSESSLTERNPIQFKAVKGRKVMSFTILIRSDAPAYELVYMAGTRHYPELIAVTTVLIPNRLWEKPQHVRLSLVSSSTHRSSSNSAVMKMRVMWTETSLAPLVRPFGVPRTRLRWGTSPGEYTESSFPTAIYTYDKEQLCERTFHPAGASGFSPPGLQFEAIMNNLKPRTTYYYNVEGSDEEFVLTTPPKTTNSQPSKMIVMGDVGQSMFPVDGSLQHSFDNDEHGELQAPRVIKSITRLLQSDDVSLVNHIGDISYATGQTALWDNFMFEIEPAASQVGWMVGIGNHEMGWSMSDMPGSDSLGECGVPYAALFPFARTHPVTTKPADGIKVVKRFPMSKAQALKNEKLWHPFYSYKHGNVHVVMMSTEHDFSPGSVQYMWINKELANINRTETPWVLFLGHRPMYVSDKFEAPVTALLKEHVEPLLFKYSVDVAMWGHHHSYQRARCRVYQGKCNKEGTHQIVTGAGGFEHSPIGNDTEEIWAIKDNTSWGVSLLDFKNETHVNITFIEHKNDKIIDQFWVQKQAQTVDPPHQTVAYY
uniref:Purple acid phosphatase n=1 Tax=Aplanochytrium stocchinoi TaxID=215587 RepID=A0A7S3PI94_9STRA